MSESTKDPGSIEHLEAANTSLSPGTDARSRKWALLFLVALVVLFGVYVIFSTHAAAADITYNPSQFQGINKAQIVTKSNGWTYWPTTGSMTYANSGAEVSVNWPAGMAVPSDTYCVKFGVEGSNSTANVTATTVNRLINASGAVQPTLYPAATQYATGLHTVCNTSTAVTAASNTYGVVHTVSVWAQSGRIRVYSFQSQGGAVLPPATGGPLSLKVVGAQLVDQNNKTVQLRGINRAGTEYTCTQQQNRQFISDPWLAGAGGTRQGTTLAYADKVASSLLSWDKTGTAASGPHAINTVRIPLNEACWLGNGSGPAGAQYSGLDTSFTGAPYRAFIQRLVDDIKAQGMYVILDLHWAGAGTWVPGANGQNGQNLAPNQDHSIDMWRNVATTFSSANGYGGVAFDLFNEPGLSCRVGSGCPTSVLNSGYMAQDDWAWKLYRDGGSYTYNADDGAMYSSRVGQTWQVAGTQQLLNAIRATGAQNPIIIETLGYGNGYIDMMGSHMPTDPANQLVASIHSYDFSGYTAGDAAHQTDLDYVFNNLKRLDGSNVAGANITGRFPIFFGEIGTTQSCPSTNPTFMNNVIGYLHTKGYSYAAWGWDSGEGCSGPSLVANPNGNDTGATTDYGALIKAGLQSKQ